MLRTAARLFAILLAVAVLQGGAERDAVASDSVGEMMKARGQAGEGDPAKIRELRALLRKAEQEQATRKHQAADAAAKGKADAAVADPQVATGAAAVAAPPAAADAAKEGEAEEPEVEAPKPVYRPAGCMYSGTKLIWEKTPGTCD